MLGDLVLDATSSQLALDDQQVADEFVQARLNPRAGQATSGETRPSASPSDGMPP